LQQPGTHLRAPLFELPAGTDGRHLLPARRQLAESDFSQPGDQHLVEIRFGGGERHAREQ